MTEYENYYKIHNEKQVLLEKFFSINVVVNEDMYMKSIEFLSSDFINKIECLKFIDSDGYVVCSFECEKLILLPVNKFGKYKLVFVFKKEFLEKCNKYLMYYGYEYHACECCCSDFELTEEEFLNNYGSEENEDIEISNKIVKYKVILPSYRLDLYYKKEQDIPKYNPNPSYLA
jgi:hypothetical protein